MTEKDKKQKIESKPLRLTGNEHIIDRVNGKMLALRYLYNYSSISSTLVEMFEGLKPNNYDLEKQTLLQRIRENKHHMDEN